MRPESRCRSGLVDGNGGQIVNQIIGSAIAMAARLSSGSLIILKIVDIVVGVRADGKEEIDGPRPQHARRRRLQF